MRRLLFILMAILLLPGTSISQTLLEFHAYGVTMTNNETKISTTYNANFTIIFTDEYMMFKESNIKWEFIGNVFRISQTAFYSYAFDANGVRCRVWFKAKTTEFALLGLEYEDNNFLYELKLIKE